MLDPKHTFSICLAIFRYSSFSNPIQVTSLGHISGSSISTASFGRLQVSTIAGNSPLKIGSELEINHNDGLDVNAGAAIVESSGGTAEISNQRENFQVDVVFSNSNI